MSLVRALRGLALLGAEAGALALLVALDLPSADLSDLGGWLENVAPEDAVVALVRLAALATVGYLLASTALYVIASLTRVPALIRGARAVTLPGLRRVIDGAVAATIVMSPASLVVSASPAAAHPAPVSVHAYAPSPAGDGAPTYEPTPAGGSTSVSPSSVHIVRQGDDLWRISAEHLASTRGIAVKDLRDDDIAKVWRSLVELNAPSLSSGDPNLIYAGETVQLPKL